MNNNKSITIVLIVVLIILAVSILSFMFKLMKGNFNFGGYNVSNDLVLDEVYDINFSKLEVESDASDIIIKHSDSNKYRVVIYGDEKYTSVDTFDSELRVYSKAKKCFGFCFNQNIAKIEIYIPKDFDKKIDVKNKYGNINIANFENSNISIEEDCGDVFIKSGNKVTVNNNYGNIEVDTAKDVVIREKCGDVKIDTVDNADIENEYGDIKVNSVNNYMDIKNSCGNIKIEHTNIKEDSYLKCDLGDININSTNEIYIDAKTSLGDTKIENNYRSSEITLKIDNSCGNIRVRN